MKKSIFGIIAAAFIAGIGLLVYQNQMDKAFEESNRPVAAYSDGK
jgi:hypothetical protein